MPDVFVSHKNTIPQQTPATVISQGQPASPITGQMIHPLASFCQNPAGIIYQMQETGELVLLFLRKHFITNVPWIIISIILIFLPSLISLLINFSNSPLITLPPQYTEILLLFYYVIVFAYVFVSFITWFYNISLVTDKRVVDIDFSDVVYKNVAETKLDLVQDVEYSQIGVLSSIFDYGDVILHTAGDNNNFDFAQVPHPARVTTIIENLIGGNKNAV